MGPDVATTVGRPLPDEIRRDRALLLVGRRWEVPLTTVVAPAGFGKSVLLRQAIEANLHDRRGTDVLVSCRSSDADADRLAGRVLAALEAEAAPDVHGPGPLALAVAGALGARSPQWACLVLDDVHELGEGTGGAQLVASLLRELPATGRLVLAGRSLPAGLPLARLRAGDDVVEVGEPDLVFDDADLAQLSAAQDGGTAVDVGSLGGWPALVRLSLRAGRAASMEYLRDEVLAGLSDDHRLALGVAILAGGADDTLLLAAGSATTADGLAAAVPLVDRRAGATVPHALWRDVLDQVLPNDRRSAVARAVAAELVERGHDEEALEVLTDAGDWDSAAAVVLDAMRTDGLLMSLAEVARWLGRFPSGERERPEILVLRGVQERLAAADRRDPTGTAAAYFPGGDGSAEAPAPDEPHEVLLRRAATGFVAAGRPAGVAAALAHLLWSAVDRGDAAAVALVSSDAAELEAAAPGCAGVYARVADALSAWFVGDHDAGLAGLAAVAAGELAPATRAFVELQRASMAMSRGDGEFALRATHAARQASFEATGTETVSQHLVIAWLTGDPGPVLAILDGPQVVSAPSPQDRFRAVVYAHLIGASMALAPPLDVAACRVQGAGSERDEAAIVVAAAAVDASLGDEPAARERLRTAGVAEGLDDPLVASELRHVIPYLYVLLPEMRDRLDAADLGPLHRSTRALARVVVAVREGGSPRWDDLPSASSVLTWLPLPWSVALAVAAHGAGRREGRDVIGHLLDTVGEPARAHLRGIAAGPDGDAATALLAAVPTPPDDVVHVRVLGPLEVSHGERPPGVPRRRRVRELLALLVLRGEVTRDVAMATLWPDLDADRARNNLNVTVRHLRTELEPARLGGEAPFVLRTDGDRIQLFRSPLLVVDLWSSRRSLADARAHEERGDLDAALVAYRAAVAGWRAEPLGDLAYVDVVAAELESLRADLVDAACRGAELAVARHQSVVARELADLALVHEPLGERALRALVAAAIADGDGGRTRAAVARAETAAEELGVALSPETRMLVRQAGV